MDWLKGLVSQLTEIGAVVGILAWFGKQVIGTWLKADLETHKAKLKSESDHAILNAKDELERKLTEFKQKITSAAKSDERIRSEIVAWANPIFGAVRDLKSRLENILQHGGHKALAQGYSDPNWSITYEYFLPSTVYVFSQYFCWVQMLKQELSFEMFRSEGEMQKFFVKAEEVSSKLGDFPPVYDGNGKDAQVFRLQQRAIGELLATRRGDRRACRTYSSFASKWSNPAYRELFDPVIHLIDALQQQDRRWKRLEAGYAALLELEKECGRILKLPGN